jgi:hypothetical protein
VVSPAGAPKTSLISDGVRDNRQPYEWRALETDFRNVSKYKNSNNSITAMPLEPNILPNLAVPSQFPSQAMRSCVVDAAWSIVANSFLPACDYPSRCCTASNTPPGSPTSLAPLASAATHDQWCLQSHRNTRTGARHASTLPCAIPAVGGSRECAHNFAG